MSEKPILIVEDEIELAEILGQYLRTEGYETVIAGDGELGMEVYHQRSPRMAILDIMLPKVNGVEVCKEIRKTSDIPVMMLSAKSGELDKVISLGAGADDYITKPFSPLELVARVKALLRRYEGYQGKTEESEPFITVGTLRMNKDSYEAYAEDQLLELTTKEFQVLYFFATHAGQVFSKEQIYEQVWGMNEYGDISSVAVYIRRLRSKLNTYHIDYIKTIWGVGYKFTVG